MFLSPVYNQSLLSFFVFRKPLFTTRCNLIITNTSTMMPGALALLYFSAAILIALIGLQSRRQYRPLLFVLHALFGTLSFRRITDVTTTPNYVSIIGMTITIWMGHMSYVLCLQGSKYHEPGTQWDWHRAYKMCWNVRWLGTPHEAPSNTPKPNTAAPATPQSLQFELKKASLSIDPRANRARRHKFLLSNLLAVAALYAINMLFEHALATVVTHLSLSESDFQPQKQIFFRRLTTVSTREIVIRTIVVINFVWSSWAGCVGSHCISSVFFVGVGLDEPEDWPTLMGSPWQMYSVRRFWGRFWHRSTFRTYIGYGTLVAESTLKLRRGTLAHKLCVELIVFLVSGIAHGATTRTMGYTCGYREDIGWFLANYGAILTETAFHLVFARVLGKQNRSIMRGLGAMWLFAFFFWSLPKAQFPKTRCRTG